MFFVFIEILFKMLLFKGGVLIYAEHCIYIYIYIYIYSGVHRPPEGQGRNGVTRAQSGGPRSPSTRGITIHDFIKILCHVGFSILQAV